MEDNQVSSLPVVLSRRLKDRIKSIKMYNWDKPDAISRWNAYLNGIVNHIEKRSIAFDYAGTSSTLSNNTMFNNDHGYGIGYKVMINANGSAFVFVFMANLNPEDYDLEIPPALEESKVSKNTTKRVYRLSEAELHSVVKEVIKEILLSA